MTHCACFCDALRPALTRCVPPLLSRKSRPKVGGKYEKEFATKSKDTAKFDPYSPPDGTVSGDSHSLAFTLAVPPGAEDAAVTMHLTEGAGVPYLLVAFSSASQPYHSEVTLNGFHMEDSVHLMNMPLIVPG